MLSVALLKSKTIFKNATSAFPSVQWIVVISGIALTNIDFDWFYFPFECMQIGTTMFLWTLNVDLNAAYFKVFTPHPNFVLLNPLTDQLLAPHDSTHILGKFYTKVDTLKHHYFFFKSNCSSKIVSLKKVIKESLGKSQNIHSNFPLLVLSSGYKNDVSTLCYSFLPTYIIEQHLNGTR